MATLAERIRDARRVWIKAEGFEFQVQRPTDVEMTRWRQDPADLFVARCIVDWRLKELDLVASGGGETPQFDREAFLEWVGDRPKLLKALADKILELYKQHSKAREEQQKN